MLAKIGMTETQLLNAAGVYETEFSDKGLDDTDLFWLSRYVAKQW